MKFLKKSLISGEIQKNAHYSLSSFDDNNGMETFHLDDKGGKRIATINKYGKSIFVICSGSQSERMKKALRGKELKEYKISINGNPL